ncbi:MAG: hypothetical protein HY658_03745 [Actinobacteria bacterium]|nr:hypothetical protein [Actinomycetota bacterium]
MREREDTRRRLEEEIQELERRLPAPATWVTRAAGVLVGGGVAGGAAWYLIRRRRKRRARPVDVVPAQAVIRVVPAERGDRLRETLGGDQWKGWVAMAGGLWLALRLAELRQLRRMNRAPVGAG